MEQHRHEIGDIVSLARLLEEKAEKEHKHDEYAAVNHTHPAQPLPEHSHPELERRIAEVATQKAGVAVVSGANIDIDKTDVAQLFCTNTAARPVHVRDYFVSKQPCRLNCQNILLPSGKQFAVRIYRTDSANFIMFDGMIN